MSGNNGGSTYPILMDEATLPEGNNMTWDVTPSTNISGVNGFYIAQHDLASNRMNLRDGRLAYWTSSADDGSTFRVLNLQALYNAELGTYVSVSQSHPGYVGALKSEIIEQYLSTLLPQGQVRRKHTSRSTMRSTNRKTPSLSPTADITASTAPPSAATSCSLSTPRTWV